MKAAVKRERGVGMIELMVAILICAFGLLGFVGMQTRAVSMELESYQRSQALVLLQDMVSRIGANRANANAYVSADLLGAGAVEDCAGKSGSALDLCQWGNLIRGNAEVRGSSLVGSMLGARGCIGLATGTTHRVMVSVVWQGVSSTGGATDACGKSSSDFPDETLRRAVSSTVCVAGLRDLAAPAATPRC